MNCLEAILALQEEFRQEQHTGDGVRNGKKVSIVLRMVDKCALLRALNMDKSSNSSDETDHRKAKILH